MKSRIGLDHIRSQGEGRLIHTVAGNPEERPPEGTADKPASPAPSELVPVVVHVEKRALVDLLRKDSQ